MLFFTSTTTFANDFNVIIFNNTHIPIKHYGVSTFDDDGKLAETGFFPPNQMTEFILHDDNEIGLSHEITTQINMPTNSEIHPIQLIIRNSAADSPTVNVSNASMYQDAPLVFQYNFNSFSKYHRIIFEINKANAPEFILKVRAVDEKGRLDKIFYLGKPKGAYAQSCSYQKNSSIPEWEDGILYQTCIATGGVHHESLLHYAQKCALNSTVSNVNEELVCDSPINKSVPTKKQRQNTQTAPIAGTGILPE